MPQMPSLKRSLSLPLVAFYGLGNILGAGIYVLVGKVAGAAGMLAPLSFVVAAVIATFSAFSYAELTSRYPVAAGEAVYVQEGFNWRWLTLLVGLAVAMSGMVSSATITRGFVGYFHVFFPGWPHALVVVLLLLILGIITVLGVRMAVGVAAAMTVLEMAGLLLIVFVGSDSLMDLPARLPEVTPTLDGAVWAAVMAGAFLAFYAFLGFEDMVNVAEEVREPEKNLPRGIFIALGLSTLFYVAVTLVAVLSLAPAQLVESDAPLATIYTQATGREPFLISIISLFAVVNGALIQIIMVSRILYGMSCNGWLPPFLKFVHPRTRTPVNSTVFVVTLVMLMAIFVPLVTLAKFSSGLVLSVFALINLALWRIKLRQPEAAGVRVYPLWVPVLGFFSSLALLLFELLS